MGRRYDTVSLLTDYGLDDEFAGVLKSVIRELAPHATTIDLTHGIRPFDVRGGSLALARAIPYVAEGVVLAVVDPGVGTSRKAIAVEVADGAGVLVGPDNGLLAPAVAVAGGATTRRSSSTTPPINWRLPERRSLDATCSPRRRPICATASTLSSSAPVSTSTFSFRV